MDRDALIAAGIKAYKNNEKLDPDSEGLTWLRHGIERVVDDLMPLMREQLGQEWMELSHTVRFNKRADDLTPHQRVLKFIRGGYE